MYMYIILVVLKFFASVSRIYPDKVYADDGRYFVKLCSLITEETGSELLVNALDALTGISSTGGGKLVLNKLGKKSLVIAILLLLWSDNLLCN